MRVGHVLLLFTIASCTWNIPGLPGAHADDQVACEDAATRLQSCCGANASTTKCVYEFRSPVTVRDCNLHEPQIDPDEAICILGASCDDLVRLDVCGHPENATHWTHLERSCAR